MRNTKRQWLINLRNEKNLSQDELADMCDVTQMTISNIENGTRRPSPELSKKIARIFGFNWTKFYDEDDTTQNKESG